MKWSAFLFVLVLAQFCSAQQDVKKITDISADARTVSVYPLSEGAALGTVVKTAVDIPYGTTPDWSGALDRQIGGMAWADYDGDGDLDLATGCYFSNSYPPIPYYEVLIYRNDNGILTANPAWTSTDMRSTMDVKFADINKDGRIDLLASNGDNSFASSVIYMNSEAGLSTSPSWVSSPFGWSVGACFGDVDGDGDLDMAFGNQGTSSVPQRPINIFFNNNGTYNTSPDWASVDQMITNNVAFGDVNNSRLVNANQSFTGNGSKKVFHLPMVPLYSIDTVMINGEVNIDWCYDKTGGWISFMSAPPQGASVIIKHRYVSKGDLAGSKWVYYSSGVYFHNNGSLTTTPGWTTTITTGQKGIVWDDFNRDGYSDLAIGGSGIPVYLYKNENGSLNSNPVWASTSVSPSSQELISGDIDNDGYPELACVHFSSKRIEVYKNRNGVLDTAPTWLYIAGTSATSISFGDMNGDGRLDLAVGTARTPVVVFLNQLGPVPVELISFEAVPKEEYNELTWSTATETNNSGFYIEKSNDKANWNEAGFVPGFGNSTIIRRYTYIDFENSSTFYRLRQVDFNGKYNYSKIIEAVKQRRTSISVENAYPNPFSHNTKINFMLPFEADVKIEMFNVLGEKIRSLYEGRLSSGVHSREISREDFNNGIYYVKFTAGGETKIIKTVLTK